jgi:hypothetical protein
MEIFAAGESIHLEVMEFMRATAGLSSSENRKDHGAAGQASSGTHTKVD